MQNLEGRNPNAAIVIIVIYRSVLPVFRTFDLVSPRRERIEPGL